ncbi:hypothetical protein [Terricaulis sp.]|uniref:hypothetical protein n=1 Tax=Terricaulis sp. TaxID=2768686 RepID=UPI003783EDD1
MTRTLEIRAYKLNPGAGPRFAQIFRERAEPMVRAYGMDIVAFGQSSHDADAWYLIRAFDDAAHLNRSEDEFYGSDAWRNGPREAVLDCIESYQDTVLELSAEAVEKLRTDLAG